MQKIFKRRRFLRKKARTPSFLSARYVVDTEVHMFVY